MDFGLTPAALRNGFILYILLVACLCLRAYAQAWMANRLGDPTPQQEGRLTLNPLPHMDLIGSVLMPLICIFYLQRSGVFGLFIAWTKPIPINPAHFKNPGQGYLQTQLATPLMSALVALLAAIVGSMIFRVTHNQEAADVFGMLILINASLIVLDLLPIPPLPGGLVLRHFGLISEEMFQQISRWSSLVLIIALNLGPVRMLLGLLISFVAAPFVYLLNLLAQ